MQLQSQNIIEPPPGSFLPPETAALDAARSALAYIERLAASKDGVLGHKTGFAKLDHATNGLEPGRFWLWGARPGTGKTALMTQVAVTLASAGTKVGIVSLEQPAEQLLLRAAFQRTGCSRWDVVRDAGGAVGRVAGAVVALAKLPIRYAEGPPTWSELRKTLALWSEDGVSVVFLDYLQLLDRSDPAPRIDVVGRISADIKSASKQFGMTLVGLSQLNRLAAREAAHMSHLRESGTLEQDADIVCLLDRQAEPEDPGEPVEVLLKIAKSRDGFTGSLPLLFDGPRYKFTEPPKEPF